MTNELQGRVALVTGAAGGMGTAICRRLVEAGALMVATDLQQDHELDDGVTYVAGVPVQRCILVHDRPRPIGRWRHARRV